MKVTRNGQITIPKEIRQKLGIRVGTILRVEATDDAVVYRPVPSLEELGGSLSRFGPLKKVVEDLDRDREDEH